MLVDDHAVVRMGFRLLLEGSADIKVVAEAESGERNRVARVDGVAGQRGGRPAERARENGRNDAGSRAHGPRY